MPNVLQWILRMINLGFGNVSKLHEGGPALPPKEPLDRFPVLPDTLINGRESLADPLPGNIPDNEEDEYDPNDLHLGGHPWD